MRCYITSLLLLGMVLSARGDALDTWTKQTSGVAQNLYGVAYGNHQYLCVGQSGVILVSSNGTAWQPVSSGVTNDLLAITFAAGQFLAVGKGGAIVRSTNGASWETQNSSTTNQLNGIARCGSLFLATGSSGTLLTSPDGISWSSQASGTTRSLVGAAFGNDLFIAVGQGQSNPGTVLTSADAINWVDRSSNNLGVAFYGIAVGGSVFVAIDARGVAYSTPDAINWTSGRTVNSDYVFGITFAQGFFVGVGGPFGGGSQKIVTSPDGANWRLRPVSVTNSAALRGVTYGNGYFIAVGDKGMILQSGPVSTLRLTNLSGGATLVLDGEIGRSYRLQSSQDLSQSNWTDVVTVTNTAEATQVFDPSPIAQQRFYRAVSP